MSHRPGILVQLRENLFHAYERDPRTAYEDELSVEIRAHWTPVARDQDILILLERAYIQARHEITREQYKLRSPDGTLR